ncbi:hypothetical protein Tco_1272841 [Tanacetum coccineum]
MVGKLVSFGDPSSINIVKSLKDIEHQVFAETGLKLWCIVGLQTQHVEALTAFPLFPLTALKLRCFWPSSINPGGRAAMRRAEVRLIEGAQYGQVYIELSQVTMIRLANTADTDITWLVSMSHTEDNSEEVSPYRISLLISTSSAQTKLSGRSDAPLPMFLVVLIPGSHNSLAKCPPLWSVLKHSTLDLSNPILSLLAIYSFLLVFFRNFLVLIVSIAVFHLKSISSISPGWIYCRSSLSSCGILGWLAKKE